MLKKWRQRWKLILFGMVLRIKKERTRSKRKNIKVRNKLAEMNLPDLKVVEYYFYTIIVLSILKDILCCVDNIVNKTTKCACTKMY